MDVVGACAATSALFNCQLNFCFASGKTLYRKLSRKTVLNVDENLFLRVLLQHHPPLVPDSNSLLHNVHGSCENWSHKLGLPLETSPKSTYIRIRQAQGKHKLLTWFPPFNFERTSHVAPKPDLSRDEYSTLKNKKQNSKQLTKREAENFHFSIRVTKW